MMKTETDRFPDTEALKEYDEILTAITKLSDAELGKLSKFSAGIDTINELPEKLAGIADRILKQRQSYRIVLLGWVPLECQRRQTKKALTISDPF